MTLKLGVKLVYLKGSNNLDLGFDTRLWNVLEPKLEGYSYANSQFPTLSVMGMKEVGLIEDLEATEATEATRG